MFEGNQYLLSIPVPHHIADECNRLIYAIAERSAHDPAAITKHTQVRTEFHVTLGVFHPHAFESNAGLFKKLVRYLHQHKDEYRALKRLFSGECTLTGVGHHGGGSDLISADVVWVGVESHQIGIVRKRIHDLLGFAGIDDAHFVFTDPHITLFARAGDVHGIRKRASVPLERFGGHHLTFPFHTVLFQKERGRVLCAFGDHAVHGKPTKKYAQFAKELKRSSKPDPIYNWKALFTGPYKSEAKHIKELVLEHGVGVLFRTYPKQKALEIKKLIGG